MVNRADLADLRRAAELLTAFAGELELPESCSVPPSAYRLDLALGAVRRITAVLDEAIRPDYVERLREWEIEHIEDMATPDDR